MERYNGPQPVLLTYHGVIPWSIVLEKLYQTVYPLSLCNYWVAIKFGKLGWTQAT